MAEKQTFLGKITKIIFIGGAILFFVLLAYLIIIWVPKAISLGSSVANNVRGVKEISVTTNEQEIFSGKPFSVSWNYDAVKTGEYYLDYPCDELLSMSIQSSKGPQTILCNKPFRLGEGIDNIALIPTVLKKNVFVDSKITIAYKDTTNKYQIAYGETPITLKNVSTTTNPYDGNLSASNVTTEPTNKGLAGLLLPESEQKTTTGTAAPTRYGKPDLQISNIREIAPSTLAFDVYNVGTQTSGSWNFSYTDAENPSRVIQSPYQSSLAPGQGLLTTVNFDGQSNNSQLINIAIDPYNSISESNESNNTAYVNIHADKNSNSNNYNSNDNADLVIDSIEVGRMSGSRFVRDNQIDNNDTAAVRFVVINEGGESTGTWKYEITNTPNDDDYTSGRQSTLRPGEETTIVAEFDGIDSGIYNMKIKIDSNDDVDEERENNNTETKKLEVID
jgi:hypothetical protein